MSQKIVQLKNDKDFSELYYPVTLGNAVFYNNVALINTSDGKIPSQFLPSYIDDVLEGVYINNTVVLKVDETHIPARFDGTSWKDLEGQTITTPIADGFYYNVTKVGVDNDKIVYKCEGGSIAAASIPLNDAITAHCAYETSGNVPGGETGKVYISLDTNFQYRWSGSRYVQITSGSYATGIRFGTPSPDLVFGLGGDQILDGPKIQLNGTDIAAAGITWYAPTAPGSGSTAGSQQAGNILKSGGSTSAGGVITNTAPSWIANPTKSGVSNYTALLMGTTNSGAAWDSTTTTDAAPKVMLLKNAGATWLDYPGNANYFLITTASGVEWKNFASYTSTDLDVSISGHGLAPIIPIEEEGVDIPQLRTNEYLVLTALKQDGGDEEHKYAFWQYLPYAETNWPAVSVTSTGGIMSGDQIELLKKLEWAVLPFEATASMSGATTELKPSTTTTRTITISGTKRDVVISSGIPSISNVNVNDKIVCNNNNSSASTGASVVCNTTNTNQYGRVLQYTLTPSASSKDTFTLGWKAEYRPTSASSATQAQVTGTKSVYLVHQTLWGYVNQDTTAELFNTNINAILSNTSNSYSIAGTYTAGKAFTSRAFTAFSGEIAVTMGKAWFAYPAEYGAAVDIKDSNGFSYINDFTAVNTTVTFATNGHSTTYRVYLKNSAATVGAGFTYAIS